MTSLTHPVAKPLERVPVRLRGSGVTLAGWRLEVACDQGAGAIVLVELSPQESCYRGDGVFLGFSQERLAELYRSLTAGAADGHLELLQLG